MPLLAQWKERKYNEIRIAVVRRGQACAAGSDYIRRCDFPLQIPRAVAVVPSCAQHVPQIVAILREVLCVLLMYLFSTAT